ncbi:MAG: hypothetical protein R3E58_13405 [Phycisphaerae bacterium]
MLEEELEAVPGKKRLRPRLNKEGKVEAEFEEVPGRHFPDPLPNFLVAAEFSWEVDIWRQLRNAQDATALRFLATQEGRKYGW